MAFCVKPGAGPQTSLIVTHQKQRRRTNYHQESPGEQKTHEPTPGRCNTTRSKKADRATQPRQPTRRTADQPKQNRTNTDRTTTRRNTPPNTHQQHDTHEATTPQNLGHSHTTKQPTQTNNTHQRHQHPTDHETRTTHQQHQNTRGELNHNAIATEKAIKNTQLPQKKHETTHRRTEKHQVQPHRRCKCDTHNSGGGTTQRDTAPKAGRGVQTTQTTAKLLQKQQQKHRKSNDKAIFPNRNLR